MRVAISTEDEIQITRDHFGEGKLFLIYEINREGYKLIEKRKNSTPPEEEHGSREKARGISSILGDVDVLLGFQFGPNILRIKDKFLPIVSREMQIKDALKIFLQHYISIEKELHSPRGKVGILDHNDSKFILLQDKNAKYF